VSAAPKQHPTGTDYATSGRTIQEAMVELARLYPDKAQRPDHILWEGHQVKTADLIQVPNRGHVELEFLSPASAVIHGVDMSTDGWFQLLDGKHVNLLRTWNDPRYESIVTYPYFSKTGTLHVWNVCRVVYPGGKTVEEKWTGNSAFRVERLSNQVSIYSCSHAESRPPDFEAFIFKLTIRPDK
jgi:hypothetical protein